MIQAKSLHAFPVLQPEDSAKRTAREELFGNFTVGDWTIQPELHTISGGGRELHVEPKVMQVLVFLARHAGEVVARKRILHVVWEGAYVTEDVLTRSISELRRIFGDDPRVPRYIQTIHKNGYRLIASATPLRHAPEEIGSVAVLPFTNAGGDEQTEYLSEGVAECILNRLSELPELRVMARSTVFRYRGREISPQAAARELGVGAVVVGRVGQVAQTLYIQAELVDANGWRLWGGQYTRKPSDIFAIPDEISSTIAEKLVNRLTGRQPQAPPGRTNNLEAFHAYLKGRHFLNRRTEPALQQAVGFFERAIELDPSFAAAYTGLADGYCLLACQIEQGLLPPRVAFAKALSAVERALAIDGGLAEAHTSLGGIHHMFHWDWAAAERAYGRALELKPNHPPALHWRGLLRASMRSFEDAAAELKLAQALDPLSPMISTDAGRVLYYWGRYEEAAVELRKALELDPDFIPARIFLGLCCERQGRIPEAVAEWNIAIRYTRANPVPVAILGQICAAACRQTSAGKWVKTLHSLSQKRFVPACALAASYARLADADRAFEWLEKAFAERSTWLVYMNVDPLLDNLRNDARFDQFVRRVGLPSR